MKIRFISVCFGVMVAVAGAAACSSTGNGGGGTGGVAESSSVPTGGNGGTGGGGGANPFTGTKSCAELIGTDTTNFQDAKWSMDLTEADFADAAAFDAWSSLNTCVCETAATGCQLLCVAAKNGVGNPTFCDGTAPVNAGQCVSCIGGAPKAGTAAACATELETCLAN